MVFHPTPSFCSLIAFHSAPAHFVSKSGIIFVSCFFAVARIAGMGTSAVRPTVLVMVTGIGVKTKTATTSTPSTTKSPTKVLRHWLQGLRMKNLILESHNHWLKFVNMFKKLVICIGCLRYWIDDIFQDLWQTIIFREEGLLHTFNNALNQVCIKLWIVDCGSLDAVEVLLGLEEVTFKVHPGLFNEWFFVPF